MLPPIAYLHIRNRSCFRKSATLKRNVAPHFRTSTMECGSGDLKKVAELWILTSKLNFCTFAILGWIRILICWYQNLKTSTIDFRSQWIRIRIQLLVAEVWKSNFGVRNCISYVKCIAEVRKCRLKLHLPSSGNVVRIFHCSSGQRF
jgi:hypothetical protein